MDNDQREVDEGGFKITWEVSDSPASATERPQRGRRHARATRASHAAVAALVLASGVAGARAGCRPTGNAVLDPLYTGLLAAAVALAAARASRATVLITATGAAMLSRGLLWAPAGAALAIAFAAAFPRKSHQRINALVGAIAIQVILRWPNLGFHGLTALAAVLIVSPVLVSRWTRLRPRGLRLAKTATLAVVGVSVVLALPVVIGALLARSDIDRGTSTARHALDALSDGNSPTALAQLRSATSDLSTARGLTASWWTLGGLVVPGVAQQRRAMAAATVAAHSLTSSASAEAGALNFHTLAYQHGQINLAAISALEGPLTALDGQVAAAQRRVESIQSPWLVGPVAHGIQSFSKDLTRAKGSADTGILVAKDAPGLLGADGPRHYFLAFVTPAETRGYDGLVGAYGEVTADAGRISLTRSGPIGQLDDAINASGPAALTDLADYVARYGGFKVTSHFQDVTYSPDLPTLGRVISEMYPAAGGQSIDGVLVMDPEALADILNFTGPLTIPGLPGTLTAANATNILLRQQYALFPQTIEQSTRHDLLINVLQEAFVKISTGSLPSPERLASTLAPAVHQGRLSFWSDQPNDEQLLVRVGLGGMFPQPGPGSDLLAVTNSNAANNKIDAYLTEHISDQVSYNPSYGAVNSTVTLSLTNGAPASGLPGEVIGSFPGSGLPLGTNYSWITVYSPLDLEDSTIAGKVVGFSPGVSELGVKAYSSFVAIPAMSSTTITLTFSGNVTPGPDYHLAVRLQPLANEPTESVSVRPAGGWNLAGSKAAKASWQPAAVEVQSHTWRFARRHR